ncbi:hypothetical protein [Pseudorhodobacter sp. MZDSW-24AT]|uniref:hypothetical protein n=1 Tax=Pseudorhodobacter sp. MZDSW-24AT TaxID=2052957 RepID=UPI000C1E20A5|nr:hypothetical protein [Pseudorhodobacter sp. MZDSW-24AT]PJF10783.1 hypothetical protein CUR21_02170 [Pseudorhodobacter sp. MZDSW-24AT]
MHDTLSIAPKLFTLATSGAVAAVRLQNLSPHSSLFVQVTTANTAPDDLRGAVKLGPLGVLLTDLPLHHLFPGVVASGGTGFVWVWAETGATLSVSHA